MEGGGAALLTKLLKQSICCPQVLGKGLVKLRHNTHTRPPFPGSPNGPGHFPAFPWHSPASSNVLFFMYQTTRNSSAEENQFLASTKLPRCNIFHTGAKSKLNFKNPEPLTKLRLLITVQLYREDSWLFLEKQEKESRVNEYLTKRTGLHFLFNLIIF